MRKEGADGRAERAAGLVWFRRDLRADDNAALAHALASFPQVHCVFLFDSEILAGLPRHDRRVEFIRDSLVELDARLRERSHSARGGLIVLRGRARDEIPRIARELGVAAVFTNDDYEPAAVSRDRDVHAALEVEGIAFHAFRDQVIFERAELLTQGGRPYSVFTPYKRAWLARVSDSRLAAHDCSAFAHRLAPRPSRFARAVPALADLGFATTDLRTQGFEPGTSGARVAWQAFEQRLDHYADARDFPALPGTSRLSVHLRFGTISVRELSRLARTRADQGDAGAATWLSELIWRDFYFQVLANFPHLFDEHGRQQSFRPEYDRIEWEDGPDAQRNFDAWCEGRTGFPLIDAAMRQLDSTGYMHNRLRMVTASFLCKDLGIDWRRGERFFARQLNDYDLSANNGGWQWASSTGCDAQPWFRIFHPVTQGRRFDAQGDFIRRYVPEVARLSASAIHAPWEAKPLELEAAGVRLGHNYPPPLVDHAQAREKTLRRYAVVKGRGRDDE